MLAGQPDVLARELTADCDQVRPHSVVAQAAQRIPARAMRPWLTRRLPAAGKRGVPHGGGQAPWLRKRSLPAVEHMVERAQEKPRRGQRTAVESARCADDLGGLLGPHPRQGWRREAGETRLREAWAILQGTGNEPTSRLGDLAQGESCGCLGCDWRRIRRRAGRGMPVRLPQGKTRTALLRRWQEEGRRLDSPPGTPGIAVSNPLGRGWGTSCAFGPASRGCADVRRWGEKKVRRPLARAGKRRGFGGQRWRRRWLDDTRGLLAEYRVPSRLSAKAGPVG
jgi:RNA-directed DNA polymerase